MSAISRRQCCVIEELNLLEDVMNGGKNASRVANPIYVRGMLKGFDDLSSVVSHLDHVYEWWYVNAQSEMERCRCWCYRKVLHFRSERARWHLMDGRWCNYDYRSLLMMAKKGSEMSTLSHNSAQGFRVTTQNFFPVSSLKIAFPNFSVQSILKGCQKRNDQEPFQSGDDCGPS